MIELLKRRRDDNGSLCYHFFQCSIRCPNIFSKFIHNHSSFVHILPFNLHKIMFIFWMSNVFLILPWYLFFRQCCLLSGILAESSVYFRRKNYSGLREYSAYKTYKSSSMFCYTLVLLRMCTLPKVLHIRKEITSGWRLQTFPKYRGSPFIRNRGGPLLNQFSTVWV